MRYRRVPFAAHIQGNTTTGFMAGLPMSKVILKAKVGARPGWGGFFGWLASTHPQLYNRARVANPAFVQEVQSDHSTGSRLLAGDGTVAPASSATIQKVIDTIVSAGSAILPLVQQQKILKLQLERAKQGLAPLDVGQYVDPNQGLNVGLNPATQKTMLWLGGGALAAFALSRLMRSRR
jgi:hypothetical protein